MEEDSLGACELNSFLINLTKRSVPGVQLCYIYIVVLKANFNFSFVPNHLALICTVEQSQSAQTKFLSDEIRPKAVVE